MNDTIIRELEFRQGVTGLEEDMVARDMLQTRILSAIFDTAAKREIALKGGLAMRANYGSQRFTKDIDLQSSPDVPMPRVKSIVENALKAANAAGILEDVVVTAPKQTDTVQRWKVNGKVVGGGSLVNLTIEVSRRGLPPPELVSTIAYAPDKEFGQKAVMIDVYSPQAIALAKMDCILNPNRTAPRDIYDLYLLIKMEVYPPIEILRLRGKDALVEGLKEVWNKIDIMTWDLARQELLPFISAGSLEITEESWEEMRTRTGLAVEEWLEEALKQEQVPGS